MLIDRDKAARTDFWGIKMAKITKISNHCDIKWTNLCCICLDRSRSSNGLTFTGHDRLLWNDLYSSLFFTILQCPLLLANFQALMFGENYFRWVNLFLSFFITTFMKYSGEFQTQAVPHPHSTLPLTLR